jgi:hypothetical protein
VGEPWGLVAAGVAAITEAKLTSWQSYIALLLFCLVATAVCIARELYAGFRPEQAQEFQGRIRTWIDTHTDQAIIVVSLVLGLWLVARASISSPRDGGNEPSASNGFRNSQRDP